MEWQKSVTAFDIIGQSLQLIGGHRAILLPVAIHHHSVEMLERLRIEDHGWIL